MIEIGVNGITKNYGYRGVLSGASFEIMTGERAAIVGPNGAGKTTLFRLIAGLESPDQGTVTLRRGATIGLLEQIPHLYDTAVPAREVLAEPFAPVRETERALRRLEALLGETGEAEALEPLLAEYAALQDRFTAQDGYRMEEDFDKLVHGFQLEPLLDRPFNVLSGGQKTIVKLASVILTQPDILLLDEPTNHLDIRTLDWFESFLAKYRGTVVMISHDRYFLDRVATKTILLERGKCEAYHGNYSYTLKERERRLLREFEQYKSIRKQIAALREAARRCRDWAARGDNPAFYGKALRMERKADELEAVERPQMEKKSVPLHFQGDRSGREVLRLRDFSLRAGEQRLFEGADLLVLEKEKVCLLGENGTGKTSLLRAILGEAAECTGEAAVNPSAKTGYIPQEIRFPVETDTVLDAFRREFACPEGEARSILAQYGFLGENVRKRVSALSGGEKVMLVLALLLRRKVNFLVLDEPTNHIDIEMRELLEESLAEYQGTLLFVSHDRYFIHKLATRVVEIRGQKLVPFEGTFGLPDEAPAPPAAERADGKPAKKKGAEPERFWWEESR